MRLRPPEHEFLEASLAARAEQQQVRQVEQRRTTDAERRARRRTAAVVGCGVDGGAGRALATFAWLQRQDARDAQTEPGEHQEAQRLVNLAASALANDAELSLTLAMYAVRSTASLGYAVPEAIDAVQWALQEMGVQYDITNDTPTAARFGPAGVHGVWVLPVAELMDLAASTERTLSTDECLLYFGNAGCPAELSVAGLQYLGGVGAYSSEVPFDQAEVVVAIPGDSSEWLQNLQAIAEKNGVRISGR